MLSGIPGPPGQAALFFGFYSVFISGFVKKQNGNAVHYRQHKECLCVNILQMQNGMFFSTP
ncbi:hypothetical protein DPT58_25055 [Salmonella enterica subsp. enterica serovar Newport]|nr:hypothetical protein [Salmonella enterica subsp. enterica serovar Newport]